MTKQQILELEDKAVTLEQLEAIEESTDVKCIRFVGRNPFHSHMQRVRIVFTGDEVMIVYL